MVSAHVIFAVNQTKIKGGCQSGRKVVPHDSKCDLPLVWLQNERSKHRKACLGSPIILFHQERKFLMKLKTNYVIDLKL